MYEGATFYSQDKIDFYQNEPENDSSPAQQAGDFKATFYNPFEIKHRRRTSRAQFKVLEKTFLENPKPNAVVRRWLAQKLSMTPRGVQVWFQNRRAKEKTANVRKSKQQEEEYPVTSTIVPSSPEHSICLCQDCQPSLLLATPMSRTTSYPPFYSSDGSTTADDEEFLMTPVTPFVDQQQQQQLMYDTMLMNNEDQMKQNWVQPLPTWSSLIQENTDAFNYVNNTMMFDNSTPNEFFRRLSEPIFDQHLNLIHPDQFNFLTRNNFGSL
ncbi:Homeobox protein HD-10 [Choanephora cucurbitarum]|uniref:Homeobox protein HD-10 n=1 Tax=Choanephora cucurbitarum TaxID=101091 RepID=A0A1C7MUB6_9FUNG|nr:Homeobox protein HD-10 [Choanephora cucurbitarum]